MRFTFIVIIVVSILPLECHSFAGLWSKSAPRQTIGHKVLRLLRHPQAILSLLSKHKIMTTAIVASGAVLIGLPASIMMSDRMKCRMQSPLKYFGTVLRSPYLLRAAYSFGRNRVALARYDYSILHLAASNGDVELARLLVTKCHVNVNLFSAVHQTPLHIAAQNGSAAMVQALAQLGANINAQDYLLLTPLDYATLNKRQDIVQILTGLGAVGINAGDAQGRTRLHRAAMDGRTDAARYFLQAGADVNARAKYNITPLHLAAGNGHEETMRVLLEAHANVDARDATERTPLHWASQLGRVGAVRLLVQAHADAAARDRHGSTPAHLTSNKAIHDLF